MELIWSLFSLFLPCNTSAATWRFYLQDWRLMRPSLVCVDFWFVDKEESDCSAWQESYAPFFRGLAISLFCGSFAITSAGFRVCLICMKRLKLKAGLMKNGWFTKVIMWRQISQLSMYIWRLSLRICCKIANYRSWRIPQEWWNLTKFHTSPCPQVPNFTWLSSVHNTQGTSQPSTQLCVFWLFLPTYVFIVAI